MKPILFNTEMVRAILDSRKTVTRRLMKPQPFISCEGLENECRHDKGFFDTGGNEWACCLSGCGIMMNGKSIYHAPYNIGDILYVRETWEEWTDGYVYKVPDPQAAYNYPASFIGKWKPSLHMPKEAARIFLRVTGVKVEKLQDITVNGAKKEGSLKRCEKCSHNLDYCGEQAYVTLNCMYNTLEEIKSEFVTLWNSTIKKRDYGSFWQSNPWVWVIEFDRISKDEAFQ